MPTRRQQLADSRYETVNVRVCRDCGARYATPGMTASHTQATGHTGGFKTVKERRLRQPSRVTYQPGYGPG